MRRELTGTSASRGLALGRARIREPHSLDIPEETIAAAQVEEEIDNLHRALEHARAELAELRRRVHGAIAAELGDFLDLHGLILDDPELLGGIDALIRTGHYSAAYALKLQRDRVAAVFDGMDDPYLKSRKEDMDHAIARVFAALHRGQRPPGSDGLSGEVLVTDTVAPSEIGPLIERGVVAIVTSAGSVLSHSAILARSLHLPMIVGAHDALRLIDDGQAMMVDASAGTIVVEPEPRDLRRFRKLQQDSEREHRQLERLRSAPTRTRDGCDVTLSANAESREDVAEAFALGAAGIGLYRTEFLFLQRRELPDEEEQFVAYRDVVLGMNGRPVTIRTLDLGADKADASGLALAGEPNPALGVRGVRLSLRREPLFRTQLRAILRASGYGPVRVLVPMVSTHSEVRRARVLLDACARTLRSEGHEIGERIELGAMVEVPAAAMALATWIGDVDFVSVGTNDLVQYLLAVDRNNDALGELYSPLHPAVLRLLRDVIACGQRRGKPVFVCGEIAGDPQLTPLLLALGLTDFSLHPNTLLEVRRAVRASDREALRRGAGALLRAPDREAIERWMRRWVDGS